MVESGEALMLCAHTCVTGRKACVGGLIFRRIDMSPRSVLSAELTPGRRKGIYFYVFDDGTAYVGKSVDMVGRYAQHMHEYKHRGDFDGKEKGQSGMADFLSANPNAKRIVVGGAASGACGVEEFLKDEVELFY